MTRLLSLAGLILLVSCGNGDSDKGTTTTDPAAPAIQNVNGNQPDTSNSIRLNGVQPTDSSGVKDSTGH